MRRLADAREHLDGPLANTDLLDGNLRDLRRINRQLGGTNLSLRALRDLVAPAGAGGDEAPDTVRILDVGCGAGDMAFAFVRAAGPWARVEVTAVDSRPEIVEAARRVSPELAGRSNVRLDVADGLSLPYPDHTFDIAHASLVIHHLDGADAVAFLRELARVARIGVVVNDLQRGWLPWLGAWLVLHAMTRNAFTLHDGPLSVRRSYTAAEMRDLLAAAGLRVVAEHRGFANHRWATAAAPR